MSCTFDNFLVQHVDEPTRSRGSDVPSILDLIFTNEEGMIDEIRYASPLGKSDHSTIIFNMKCYWEAKEYIKQYKMYDKANYKEIKRELSEYNWKEKFEKIDVRKVGNIYRQDEFYY